MRDRCRMAPVCESISDTRRLIIPNEILTENALTSEFSGICRSPVKGIFVVPHLEDPKVWNGVIFIRRGFFTGGIFRFLLTIPNGFPNTKDLPTISLEKPIIHPLYSAATNELDVSRFFPEGWNRNKHSIKQVLSVLKKSFSLFDVSIDSSLNPNAAALYRDQKKKFKELSAENVGTTRATVYDEGLCRKFANQIKFKTWNSSTHGQLKKLIIRGQRIHLYDSGETTFCGNKQHEDPDTSRKCFPSFYSWFNLTEMTVLTKYADSNKQILHGTIEIATKKYSIEPLDFTSMSSGVI